MPLAPAEAALRRACYTLVALIVIYPVFMLRDRIWQFDLAAGQGAVFRTLLARNLLDAIFLAGVSVLLVKHFPFEIQSSAAVRWLVSPCAALAAGAFLVEGALVAASVPGIQSEQALPPFWLVTRLAYTGPEALVLIMSVGLLTPLVEEVFFRGMLYRSLAALMPAWQAVLFSSAGFALLHASGMMPVAFVLGVMAAILVERSGRLLPAVALHTGLNCGFVAYNFDSSRLLKMGALWIATHAAGGALFLVLGAFLLHRLPRPVAEAQAPRYNAPPANENH